MTAKLQGMIPILILLQFLPEIPKKTKHITPKIHAGFEEVALEVSLIPPLPAAFATHSSQTSAQRIGSHRFASASLLSMRPPCSLVDSFVVVFTFPLVETPPPLVASSPLFPPTWHYLLSTHCRMASSPHVRRRSCPRILIVPLSPVRQRINISS